MPLAYYSRSATTDFWEEHWGRQSPEALARIAETSPLTGLILKNLPPAGARVLEAAAVSANMSCSSAATGITQSGRTGACRRSAPAAPGRPRRRSR